MIYIDGHTHLFFNSLGGYTQKTHDLVKETTEKGIIALLDLALTASELPSQRDFSKQYENIFNGIAIHPFNVHLEENLKITLSDLLEYVNTNNKVIAIGETGLDFNTILPVYSAESSSNCDHVFNNEDELKEHHKMQINNLEMHFELAAKTKLPIIIHCKGGKKAEEEMFRIISYYSKHHNVIGVMHGALSHTSEWMIKNTLDMGYYVSFFNLESNKENDLKNLINYLPLNKILSETDSPVATNSPLNVIDICLQMANLRNINQEDFCYQLIDNFTNLFVNSKSTISNLIKKNEK